MTDDPNATANADFAEVSSIAWPPGYLWSEQDQARYDAIRNWIAEQPAASADTLIQAVVNAEIGERLIRDQKANGERKIGQLEQMLTQAGELAASREQGWMQEANELQAQLTAINVKKNEYREQAERSVKLIEKVQETYGKLMDEHYALSQRMARHEGYIDRVRERDAPVERLTRRAQKAQQVRYALRGFDQKRDIEQYGTAATRAETPWYRRNQ